MDPQAILLQIGVGIFYGIQAAFFGYMKDSGLPVSWTAILTKKFWENFDPIKALKTILLGGVLGGLGAFNTLNLQAGWLDPVEAALVYNFAYAALTMGIDQFVKFVVRRTPLIRVWNWLKAQFGILPVQ